MKVKKIFKPFFRELKKLNVCKNYKKNAAQFSYELIKKSEQKYLYDVSLNSKLIEYSFCWKDTSEGFDFWSRIFKKLNE